jgi:ribonuclease J
VRAELLRLFGEYRNRIVVTCFASNIARLESIVHAATKHRRSVALVGRSLWRMVETAREAGYLRNLPEFLTEDEIDDVPRGKIVIVCTGSQGEARAALPRIASGGFRSIRLDRGDVVVFSSRVIPGNEKAIFALQNRLSQAGLEIVTSADRPIHVSGHPARDELARMYQWVRPRLAVPVHGEIRHLAAHAGLAGECQVPESRIISNGDVLRLAPGPFETIAQVPAGRLVVDGPRLLPMESPVIRERRRASFNGSVLASLVLDQRGRLMADPQVSAPGLIDPDDPDGDGMLADAQAELEAAVKGLGRGASDDDRVREVARTALRRVVRERLGKKPVAEIHLVRI